MWRTGKYLDELNLDRQREVATVTPEGIIMDNAEGIFWLISGGERVKSGIIRDRSMPLQSPRTASRHVAAVGRRQIVFYCAVGERSTMAVNIAGGDGIPTAPYSGSCRLDRGWRQCRARLSDERQGPESCSCRRRHCGCQQHGAAEGGHQVTLIERMLEPRDLLRQCGRLWILGRRPESPDC